LARSAVAFVADGAGLVSVLTFQFHGATSGDHEAAAVGMFLFQIADTGDKFANGTEYAVQVWVD